MWELLDSNQRPPACKAEYWLQVSCPNSTLFIVFITNKANMFIVNTTLLLAYLHIFCANIVQIIHLHNNYEFNYRLNISRYKKSKARRELSPKAQSI